jgi:hypothetical protein
MVRGDRPKLPDLIAQHGHPFARRVNSFEESYPTIKSLRAKIIETKGIRQGSWTAHFTEKDFPHSFPCSNPECYAGGVILGFLVHEMARERETEKKVTERCRGYEGSPKGRRRYGPCMHSFAISIEVEYRDASE